MYYCLNAVGRLLHTPPPSILLSPPVFFCFEQGIEEGTSPQQETSISKLVVNYVAVFLYLFTVVVTYGT